MDVSIEVTCMTAVAEATTVVVSALRQWVEAVNHFIVAVVSCSRPSPKQANAPNTSPLKEGQAYATA
jgi:hypothetical protein